MFRPQKWGTVSYTHLLRYSFCWPLLSFTISPPCISITLFPHQGLTFIFHQFSNLHSTCLPRWEPSWFIILRYKSKVMPIHTTIHCTLLGLPMLNIISSSWIYLDPSYSTAPVVILIDFSIDFSLKRFFPAKVLFSRNTCFTMNKWK